MKKLIFVFFLFTTQFSSGEVIKCPVENFVVFPQAAARMLKLFPQSFMTVKISSAVETEKPVLIKKGTSNPLSLVAGQGLSAGDIIKTSAGQTIELKFFMPSEQTITIGENSEVRIRAMADLNCQSAFEILKGRITSEGTHAQIQEIKNCMAEITTENSEVRPTGTKYSVDLSEAISEASGESVQTENYSVEKGSIQIKLRRSGFTVKPTSKSVKIAKNGAVKLSSGQKAKVKINTKTKLADVQVVEP